MDNILNQIVRIVNNNKHKIVTISETSHWSKTSHEFHFNLLKKLLTKTKINTFSSERLGVLDAILMNAWLEGKIKCPLMELYEEILPFGGLGTYSWMEYFKKTKNKFNLVGCEVDAIYPDEIKKNKRLCLELGKLCSPELKKHLKYGAKVVELKKYAKTKLDKEILAAISKANKYGEARQNWDALTKLRIKEWTNNVKKIYAKYGNLYINGYHLGKSTKMDNIKFPIKPLILGLASYQMQLFTVYISEVDLKKCGLTIENYGEMTSEFSSCFAIKINTTPRKKWVKRYIDKYAEGEAMDYMRKYRNMWKLVKIKPNDKEKIINYGAWAFPVNNVKKINPYLMGYVVDVKNFDYVIFMPKSEVRWKMFI